MPWLYMALLVAPLQAPQLLFEGGARLAVVIGANEGMAGDARLRYADNDAEQMAQVLESLGGFAHEDITLLRTPTADAVRAAFRALATRVADSGEDSLLVVYYSGHADALALRLRATALPWNELLALTKSVGATTRLVVVDACRSGTLTQVKGLLPASGFAAPQQQASLPRGLAIVTSATAGENAQESAALHGSFFTHHLLSALRGAGDLNGDGQVTLTEAYDYSAAQTMSDTANTLAGIQHATFRYRLSGRMDLGLTAPGRTGTLAPLKVVMAGTYTLRHDHRGGPVALEVTVPAGNHRTVWLPPGSYYVQRRTAARIVGGSVEVVGGDTTLDDAALQTQAPEKVALKGPLGITEEMPVPALVTDATTLPWEFMAAGAGGGALLQGFSAAGGASLALSNAHEVWALDAHLRLMAARARNASFTFEELDASAALGVRWRLLQAGPVGLWLGPRAGALLLNQRYTPTSGGASATDTVVAPFAEAALRLDVRLPANFFLCAEGSARALPLRVVGRSAQAKQEWAWQPLGTLGAGVAW